MPEPLESRLLLAVTANVASTTDTLAVWMTEDNDHTYVRQVGDGAGALLQISSKSDFNVIDVYNGAVPANLLVYDGLNLSMELTSGGSGYTTAPTLTIQDTSFDADSFALSLTTGLRVTTVGVTAGGANLAGPTQTRQLLGGGQTTPALVDFNIVGGVVTSITINGVNFGSNYTTTTGLTLNAPLAAAVGLTATQPTFTATGAVNTIFSPHKTSGGSIVGVGATSAFSQGHYRVPTATFSSGGASVGFISETTFASPAPATHANTGFTAAEGPTALSSNVSIGDYYAAGGGRAVAGATTGFKDLTPGYNAGSSLRISPVDTILFKAGSNRDIRVVNAADISLFGKVEAGSNGVYLALRPDGASGNINIGSSVSAANLTAHARDKTVSITGTVTTTGPASLQGDNIVIGSAVNAGTTFYGVADKNFTVSSAVSTGGGNAAFAVLQATGGTLLLDAPVTSANGAITLQANTFAGAGLVTGRSLGVTEEGGAVNYTLNANVTNFAGTTASNLAFKNAGNLTIGSGALTLTGNANTLSLESTGGSINVVANIVMSGSTAGIVSLTANNGVSITGTILPQGQPLDLTVTANTGAIAATSALQLSTGNLIASANTGITIPNLTAAKINVTTASGNLTVTETNGVDVERATVTGTGNLTITTLSGDINVTTDATVGIIGTGGTATLQSNNGSIDVKGSLTTTSSGTFVLNAANGTVTNGASGSLATGTLNWISTSGVQNLLNTPAVSKFSKLAANVTGAATDLQVATASDLELTTIVTKGGTVTVTVDNASSPANLSITGSVTAGNTLAAANRKHITFSAVNGSITSTGVVTGNVLTLTALNTSSLSNQNILQLNAAVTGAGQNLAVTATSGLTTGNVSADGGTINLSVTSGNLTTVGAIDAGSTGTVNVSVPTGKIIGTPTITTDTLKFSATAMPTLTSASFNKIAANLTASGDLVITRAGDLTVEAANTSFGNVNITLTAGNLTINGPMNANGPSNIALDVQTGSVTAGTSALTANILNVTSLNDIVLNTNVNTLIANVTGTSGNITIVEADGLIIGAGNVQAKNDISLTATLGDIVRTGQVTSNGATPGNVILKAAAGAITGTGQVTAGNLSWTSKASAVIDGTSGLTFTNLSASVTGAGNALTITGTGGSNVKVLAANTAGGALAITAGAGKNISLDGPVSAGTGNVTLTSGGQITSTTTDRVTGNQLTVTAGDTVSLNTAVTGLSANVTGAKTLTINEADGLTVLAGGIVAPGNVTLTVGTTAAGGLTSASGATITSGDSVNIVANALDFGGPVTLAGLVTATNNLLLFANGTSSVATEVANITANVVGGGLTIVENDGFKIPTSIRAAGAITITSTSGNINGAGVINAGSGNAVTLTASLGEVSLAAADAITGSTLTITAQNSSSVTSNVTTLVANIASGNLTVTEATDLVIGAGNVVAVGDITLNLANGSLSGAGGLNAGTANVTINAAAGGINVTGTIVGNVLKVDNINGAANLTTDVTTLTVNATGAGNGITVAQTGDLTIGAAGIVANDADIKITAAGGGITGAAGSKITAGVGNVTLTSTTGGITLNEPASQVTGNVLTLSAVTASNLETSVTSLNAVLTGDLQGLKVNQAVALDILGVTTNNALFDLDVATGDLGGSGVINTGTAGNATLNVSAGKVDLASVANQVVGNVLTITSQDSVDLRTKIAQVAVNVSGVGDVTIVEADGLLIAAAAVQTDTKGGDVSITAATIGGTGAIQTGTGAISLTATGAITLNSAASQVEGGDLVLSAGAASALETAVDNVAATVTGGGLTINEADALAIDVGDIAAGGSISITAAGSITGANAIDAGANTVTLKAGGAVTLNSASDQVTAGTLNVTTTAAGDVSVTTNVATLVANVNVGDLTVSESSGLAIGAANVIADGDILITLTDDGSLTGTGTINATGAVNLTLGGTGSLALASVGSQVTGTTLTIAVTDGSVNVNTSVDNLNASASGAITVVEANKLTVDSIETTDGDVKITLTAGDLTIDTDGIQAGQVGNVTLNAAAGAINSSGGTVFANVLTLTANSTSEINTSITTLVATVTGEAQSLTIHEADNISDPTPDGLTIASVVTNSGDVTLNVSTGNLGGTGSINTLNTTTGELGNVNLNVSNGSATLNFLAGQIVANELAVSVLRSSSLNTNVASLNQFGALDSILGVANVASIKASAATDVVTATGHTFINGDKVQLRNLSGGNGLANDTNYFVINANTNTLQLATKAGGSAINLTSDVTDGTIYATQLLTITEVDDLEIAGDVVAENDADITIAVGGDLLQAAGTIDATSGNVTLTALSGGIPAALVVAAASGLLTVTARDNSFLDSAVERLTANITAGLLDVNQTGDLEIAAGNVRATGGVVIKLDDNLSGNGTITAVSNNVTLNSTAGAINLTAVNGQIVGNVLNLAAADESLANTNVTSLTANITGATQNLTIVETNALAIDAGAGVKTNGGDLSIKLTQGSLTGNQVVNAGAGNVALNVLVGGVSLTGQVTAALLDVRSVQSATLGSTNVTELSANIAAGSLTVTEFDDLDIEATNGVRAFSGVTLNVGNSTTKGTLAGDGVINGGASTVTLSVVNGSVTLNDAAGQIVASTLNLTAQNSSVVNTAVTSLVANIVDADDTLEVNELDSLSIGAGNVVTNGGNVNITTGGNLSIIGQINASVATPGDVTLVVNGAVTGVGSIVANSVALTAVNSSALNVNVTAVEASVSRDGQSLSIASTKALSIDGADVTTSNGAITISTAAGGITVSGGALNAGAANVTLSSAGGITATAGNVAGNVLTVTAAGAVSLTTAVTSLSANVTGSTNSFTVVEDDSLTIGTGGIRTVNGVIDIELTAGGLTLANPVNAGTANVKLNVEAGGINGTGAVTGNVLTVNVAGDSTLFSNVTEIEGTTSSGILSINAAAGLKIATGNLTASGTGGLNLVATNGAINLVGGIAADGGAVTLTTLRGDVTGANSIDAAASNVTINANGSVALESKANQLAGNVLTVVSSGNVAIKSDINGLTATLNGTERTLSIVDSGDFKLRGTGVSTNNANITLSAADGIDLAANVSAGNRTISLVSSAGGFTGLGILSATNLTLDAADDTSVATKVANIAAKTAGGDLVVNQTGSLTVRTLSGINGVSTDGGSVTLNVSGGSINGTGAVNAGAGDVVLNAATGAITLNSAAGQIVGDVVTLRAQNSSTVNLAATTFGAKITGAGQALTVADNDALELANVTTSGGLFAVQVTKGDLNGTGLVNVGAGNVTLNVAGSVDLAATVSQITANDLSIKAGGAADVNTSVTTLSANVTGELNVTEFNGLALTTGDVVAGDDVTVTVSAGNLTGTRAVTSKTGDVTLAATAGAITLTSRTGQVSGDLLTVTALSGASVNTNVANLTATVTGGSLTVSQTKSLNVADAAGINTAAGGGNVTLTILNGNLGRDDGAINAGTGTVTLNVSRGNVTLNADPNLVTANVLNLVSRGDAAINTAVGTIGNAAITSTGSLTITEADALTITRATAARNNVNVNAAGGTLTVANITASLGTVNLTGSGDVNVGAPGITAGTLDLTGVNVSVSGGGNLSARTVSGQTSSNPVNWLITTVPTGAGSLGSVLNQVNNFNGSSLINVTTPTTLSLSAALPQIRQSLTLQGNGQLTLNRGSVASTAAGFTIANPGATTEVVINGVTLRDFGTGIDLRAGSKSNVTNVTVLNATTGLKAAGSLTGTVVTRSTFDGQNRASSTGAALSSALGLSLGENTSSFNTFRNVRDGLSATGTSTGTKVYGNRFEAFARYGLSLVGVRSIEIGDNGGNLSLRNTIGSANAAAFGVFASGTSTGSKVNNMAFESTFLGTRYRVSQSSGLTITPPIS